MDAVENNTRKPRELPEELAGREAVCIYGCGERRQSAPELAFFKHRPELAEDEFYCGCRGWD